jgi:hypothetical protein
MKADRTLDFVRMPFKVADRGAGIFLTLRPSLNLLAPRRD